MLNDDDLAAGLFQLGGNCGPVHQTLADGNVPADSVDKDHVLVVDGGDAVVIEGKPVFGLFKGGAAVAHVQLHIDGGHISEEVVHAGGNAHALELVAVVMVRELNSVFGKLLCAVFHVLGKAGVASGSEMEKVAGNAGNADLGGAEGLEIGDELVDAAGNLFDANVGRNGGKTVFCQKLFKLGGGHSVETGGLNVLVATGRKLFKGGLKVFGSTGVIADGIELHCYLHFTKSLLCLLGSVV